MFPKVPPQTVATRLYYTCVRVYRLLLDYACNIYTGGYFANSLAIMTDAAHMLSDFAGFLISLFAIWVSKRPPSRGMSFGWYRAGEYTVVYVCSATIDRAISSSQTYGHFPSIKLK